MARRQAQTAPRDQIQESVCPFELVCNFIGEDFEDGLVAFHETPAYMFSQGVSNPGSGSGKDHKAYRNWQINQKLFDGSGKWVKEMTEEEKRIFKADKDAMQILTDFSYTSDEDW